jgi:hypothetical protein
MKEEASFGNAAIPLKKPKDHCFLKSFCTIDVASSAPLQNII